MINKIAKLFLILLPFSCIQKGERIANTQYKTISNVTPINLIKKKVNNNIPRKDLKIRCGMEFNYLVDTLLNFTDINSSNIPAKDFKKEQIFLCDISTIFDKSVLGKCRGSNIMLHTTEKGRFFDKVKYSLEESSIDLNIDLLCEKIIILEAYSTKIIYFRDNDLMIALKCYAWNKKYSVKNISSIFILTKENLLPKFSIKRNGLHDRTDSLIIEKYEYDKDDVDLNGNLIIFDKIDVTTLKDLSIDKILKMERKFQERKYSVGDRVKFTNGGPFSTYPIWTDFGGVYPFGGLKKSANKKK